MSLKKIKEEFRKAFHEGDIGIEIYRTDSLEELAETPSGRVTLDDIIPQRFGKRPRRR